MKTQLLAICAGMCSGILLQAQTITASDMPSAGSTFVYSTLSPMDVQNSGSYQNGGNGVNWDFSAFSTQGNDTDAYVTPASVNVAYAFFFGANAFGREFAGNIGGGMIPISIEDIYDFYDVQNNNFRRKGIGLTISGLPLPALYTQPDIVYELPLSYNDTYTHPFEFQVNVPTLGSLKRTGVRTSVVDGSGTLITPAGTFNNCLRVRSEISQVDSVFTQFANFGIPSESVEYTWLVPGSKAPAFSVTETGAAGQLAVTEAKYRQASLSTGEETLNLQTPLLLFPNPAATTLHFSNNINGAWHIQSSTGQYVQQGTAYGANQIDITNLRAGAYIFSYAGKTYTFIKN